MDSVVCPNCGHIFPLDEGLNEIVKSYKEEAEKDLKKKEERIIQTEKELKEKEKQIPLIAEKIASERLSELRIQVERQIKDSFYQDTKYREEKIKELQKSLDETRNEEVKHRLEIDRLNDSVKQKEREIEIEIQKRTQQERDRIRNEELTKSKEEFILKENEYKEKIESLQRKLDDLNRGLSSESNQLVGEAQEIAIEERLKESFPEDILTSVQRGVRGGDIIHTVIMTNGQEAGKILWESKNTKQWKDEWIDKLKEDRTNSGCDYGIIVTRTMPKNTHGIAMMDGVTVTEFSHVIAVSSLMRVYLTNLKRSKISQTDRVKKESMLYEYVTSNEFRNRVQLLVDSISHAKEDLEREKTTLNRIWSKRNTELEKAVLGLAEIYGRMQGVAGNALPDIPSLHSSKDAGENQTQLPD